MATSSTQSGFVDSWQRGKSVTECNLHMLETEDFTDVTFLVGSEKHVVRAHRYVLASRSCVFHDMFCGRLAEQREITIPDIEVNVFKEFLRFLYTDTCTISSENIAGLLYTSRKYDVETLFTQSASFLQESLSEENLCEILEKSHGYGETDLEQRALKMLSQAGLKVIKTVGFPELCSVCFGTFLKSENLNLKEEEVFKAALSWTKAECEREGLSPSHENMRKILGEMVYEIRFGEFSLEFLTKVVGLSGILTRDERIQIMDRISEKSIDIRPFNSDKRKNQQYQGIHLVERFNSMLPASQQEQLHGIVFSANTDITLLGCQMYGSDKEHRVVLDIRLYDNDQDDQIAFPVKSTKITLIYTVNDIMFPDPVSIQAGRFYTIVVAYDRKVNMYSGSEGKSKVTVAGVEFTFTKDRLFEIFSSVEEGQIPGLIWRY